MDNIRGELRAHDVNLSLHHLQTEDSFDQLQTSIQSNLTHHLSDINEQLAVHTCGGTGGWRRVVDLNVTDSTSTCPFGWNITRYSTRTCGRVNVESGTCDSATFTVSGGEYSRVCGRIKGYQFSTIDAFHASRNIIDGNYVDGVSLTHGSPRQHIWTFAAGYSEQSSFISALCPCDTSAVIQVPSFVGDDYFCESGRNEGDPSGIFYSDDPLWDGENCGSSSTCCTFNSPPYFTKQLPTPTTDDIEARICLTNNSDNEDIAIELVELYVQ